MTKAELRRQVDDDVLEFFAKGSRSQLYSLVAYQWLRAQGIRSDGIEAAIDQELTRTLV